AGGVGHEVAVHLLGGFGVAVGAAAGEGFEQHAGQGVDVGAGVGVPGEPLGGHVGPGADGQAGGGDRGLTEGAGDAEIDEIGPAVWADQDVGGLDVAVHQARRVRGVQGGRDLGEDVQGGVRVERAVLGQPRGQVGALDEFHVDEQPSVDGAVRVDGGDVRIAQGGGEDGLTFEAGAIALVGGQFGGQQLEGDTAAV